MAVKIAKLYEKCLGPTGDAHFCVAKSMRRDLDENWGIPGASVLYDKAPASFGPTPAEEAKALHGRLEALGATTMSDFYSKEGSLREDRPALVISSTSWTPDEDFDLFLEGLSIMKFLLLSYSSLVKDLSTIFESRKQQNCIPESQERLSEGPSN